jgi:hypothetical protein
MTTDTDGFDLAEMALIGMLEARDISHDPKVEVISGKAPSGSWVTASASDMVLKNESMFPSDAYTFDLTDPDKDPEEGRLYTQNVNGLVRPVWETCGDAAELVLHWKDVTNWVGLRRRRKLPKGVATLGVAHAVYELHLRRIDGLRTYNKDLVALNSKGQFIPIQCMGQPNSATSNKTACLVASVIEDALRPNAFLATLSDAMTLRFPVGAGAHLDFFKLREAPMTPTGRRRAILHWVRSHRRASDDALIKQHTRGVQEIVMDGLRVRLEANKPHTFVG